jgi:hypothetical protein
MRKPAHFFELAGLGATMIAVAAPQYRPTFPHWLTNGLLVVGSLLIVGPLAVAVVRKKRKTEPVTPRRAEPRPPSQPPPGGAGIIILDSDDWSISGAQFKNNPTDIYAQGNTNFRITDTQHLGRAPFEGTPQNAKCPCGSGKKYKKCHGKAL